MKPRGFTLIEMVIAVALLAIVAMMSYRSLTGIIRGQQGVVEAGAQCRHNADGQQDRRERQHNLNAAADDHVDPLAVVASGQAEEQAEAHRHHHRQDAHGEREAGAGQQAGRA